MTDGYTRAAANKKRLKQNSGLIPGLWFQYGGLKMFTALDSLKPYAHWLLRIALASVFVYHGIGKVINLGGFVEMTGLPMPVAAS